MKKYLFFILILLCSTVYSETTKDTKVIYKYRQYEKFDLDEMSLEGETGSPGDLSIIPRFQKRFKNRLPYKTNFVPQIRRAVSSVR